MILVAKLRIIADRRPAVALVVLFLVLLAGCERAPQPVRLQGSVFGTGWSLTYMPIDEGPTPGQVRAALLAAFDTVNASMNTYDPSATISRFNQLSAGEPMEVDWDFTYVFNEARRITAWSDGAYDVTVAPLLALWGFGPNGPTTFPTPEALQQAMSEVGLEHFDWQPRTRTLTKLVDGASLDFSSIAKGYGVDLGADALDELGIEHFMLEVGGEMQLRGQSPRGDAWRIAIERPQVGGGVQAAISLTDIGVATSGDYRNYFEREGKRYSHLVDPRTGYPIEHDLVAATVVHPSTGIADAWATALCIMGTEDALAVAEERGLAVYVVSRVGDELVERWSSGFAPFLSKAPMVQ